MPSDHYIYIRNWGRFQHYTRRRPIWIKEYIQQIDDPDYGELTWAQQGLLHNLRMLFSQINGANSNPLKGIPETQARRRLCRSDAEARYMATHLDALNHAGLILITASNLLAPETERKKPSLRPRSVASYARAGRSQKIDEHDLDRIADELADHDARTAAKLATFADRGASEADFQRALESLKSRRATGPLASEVGYLIGTLSRLEHERHQ